MVRVTYHWTCKAKDTAKVADSELEHVSTVQFVFNDKVVVNIICLQPFANLEENIIKNNVIIHQY